MDFRGDDPPKPNRFWRKNPIARRSLPLPRRPPGASFAVYDWGPGKGGTVAASGFPGTDDDAGPPPADADMSDNQEFVREFLIEAAENLDQLDQDLIALEEQPEDSQRLASIFRTVHTIKGNSGFFGFSKLGALTHSGEHLLGRLRDGKITLNERVTGSLLSMVDAVRSILESIEHTGGEGDADFRQLSQRLAAVAVEEAAGASAAVARPSSPRAEDPPAPVAPLVAEPVAPPLATADVPVPEAVPQAPTVETASADAALVGVPQVDAARTEPAAIPAGPARTGASPGGSPAESSVRVDLGLLASILDLVGELVLARNQLRSYESPDSALQGIVNRINTVTNALQEAAVKTRMQPIEHVFSKFPRTVRDLAVACGKEVQLVVDGADTELDRSLIEGIRDPLTHLIRNAVDHGIEPPATREASGKPRAGRLLLRAFHESGQVTIEVEDDGGGIPVAAVRKKAVARGLVDQQVADTLPDDRILQFIFEPGFSTAATVTAVSGRGVGMDVVKTNIEAIGGTVDIHSRPGIGTRVRVRVPLTLAIVPAVIVKCATERFAIPQAYVSELVPLRAGQTGPRIEGLGGEPVVRIRGRLLPVVFLADFLGLRETVDPSDRAHPQEGTVVLLRVDDHEFGLVVDGSRADPSAAGRAPLLESASLSTIVVKPIGGLLAQLGIYSGATVLGDGGVVLILDLRGIVRVADLPPVGTAAETDQPGVAVVAESDRYLVCQTRSGRRIAVPLDGITRLEHFLPEQLQPLGTRRVVRRGDGFTPVIDADEWLGAASGDASPGTVNLVVLNERCGGIGIAVQRILDVLGAESDLQPLLSSQGIAGSLALGGVATEVLDLKAF
jgi:two-component system chemotaxis sensor kinase CheA